MADVMQLLIYRLICSPIRNILHSNFSTFLGDQGGQVGCSMVGTVRVLSPYQRQAVTKSDYHNYRPYPLCAELLLGDANSKTKF